MVFGLKPSRISQFDENRQILFYCGLFSSVTGTFWLLMGLIMKFAFPKPVGSSVNSVAYGIMFVGLFVLTIGVMFTATVFVSGAVKSKRSVSSATKSSIASSLDPKSTNSLVSVSVLS